MWNYYVNYWVAYLHNDIMYSEGICKRDVLNPYSFENILCYAYFPSRIACFTLNANYF